MKYIRNCPICGKQVEHKHIKSYKKSLAKSLVCRSCVMMGNRRSEGHSIKKPKVNLIGQMFNNWRVLGLSHREDGGVWYWDVECTNCRFVDKRTTNYVKTSKGCIVCGLLPKGETGLNKVISSYRDGAAQRGYSFELSKEQVVKLTSSPCYYCGQPPKTLKHRKYKDNRSCWGDYLYNGIDRVNNNIGYTVVNCVSCCEICNRSKGAMSPNLWYDYLNQFAENVINKKVPFINS